MITRLPQPLKKLKKRRMRRQCIKNVRLTYSHKHAHLPEEFLEHQDSNYRHNGGNTGHEFATMTTGFPQLLRAEIHDQKLSTKHFYKKVGDRIVGLKPCSIEDPPLRGTLAQSPPVDIVWNFKKESVSSGIILVI
ncbi:hypothetical protein TNCV_4113601 [Trichonephila clavipes]|nr:hypothetical protein TNCV_4113601 [Trichonephila clavipes]